MRLSSNEKTITTTVAAVYVHRLRLAHSIREAWLRELNEFKSLTYTHSARVLCTFE